jgi:MFS family permease
MIPLKTTPALRTRTVSKRRPRPPSGTCASRVRSRPRLRAAGSFALLALAHDGRWQIYVAGALQGIGIGFSFSAMANFIVEAVPPEQTGVATGRTR